MADEGDSEGGVTDSPKKGWKCHKMFVEQFIHSFHFTFH